MEDVLLKTIVTALTGFFKKDGEPRLKRIFFVFGILTALPFVFRPLFLLSYVSLIPVAYMMIKYGCEIKKRKAFSLGLIWGLGYFGVLYFWFTRLYPMEFADLTPFQSIIIVLVCWLGLALIQSIEMGLTMLAYRLIKPSKGRPLLRGALFIGLWVVFEFQETLGWRGVPWGRLAVTQSMAPALSQSASLFGSYFVSAVIVAVNVFLAIALYYVFDSEGKEFREKLISSVKARKSVIFASVALGIFSLNLVFGVIRLAAFNEKDGKEITAAVIQGNISSLDKWEVNAASKSTDKYIELTRSCVEKSETGVDIVVWPETVIPTTLNYKNSKLVSKISEMAKELNVTVFVGAFDFYYDEHMLDSREYNAIYIFYPDGKMGEDRYYKRHLVPFGEYTPMEDLILAFLPVLGSLNILSEPLSQGTDSEIFDTEHGKIGSLICFDSIYEMLAVDAVRDGAELITLSTNDSWFSDSAAVWQHNSHAALRAIETGRYVVRAANTGVSTVITPEGRVIAKIKPLETGFDTATVYMRQGRTLYSYVGNVFVLIAFLGVVVIAAFPRVKKLIEDNKNRPQRPERRHFMDY